MIWYLSACNSQRLVITIVIVIIISNLFSYFWDCSYMYIRMILSHSSWVLYFIFFHSLPPYLCFSLYNLYQPIFVAKFFFSCIYSANKSIRRFLRLCYFLNCLAFPLDSFFIFSTSLLKFSHIFMQVICIFHWILYHINLNYFEVLDWWFQHLGHFYVCFCWFPNLDNWWVFPLFFCVTWTFDLMSDIMSWKTVDTEINIFLSVGHWVNPVTDWTRIGFSFFFWLLLSLYLKIEMEPAVSCSYLVFSVQLGSIPPLPIAFSSSLTFVPKRNYFLISGRLLLIVMVGSW